MSKAEKSAEVIEPDWSGDQHLADIVPKASPLDRARERMDNFFGRELSPRERLALAAGAFTLALVGEETGRRTFGRPH